MRPISRRSAISTGRSHESRVVKRLNRRNGRNLSQTPRCLQYRNWQSSIGKTVLTRSVPVSVFGPLERKLMMAVDHFCCSDFHTAYKRFWQHFPRCCHRRRCRCRRRRLSGAIASPRVSVSQCLGDSHIQTHRLCIKTV